MVTCPVCGSEYDERAYQVVVKDLGSFDSVQCADSALRRRERRNLSHELIDVISSARTRSPARHEPIQTDRSH
jgi:hypothetical protein